MIIVVSSIFCVLYLFIFIFFFVEICSYTHCGEDKVRAEDTSQLSLNTNCYGGLRNSSAVVKAQDMPPSVCSKMVVLIPPVYSHHCSHPHRKNKINAFVIYSLRRGQSSRLTVGLWLPASLPAPAGARHPAQLPSSPARQGSE